MLDRPLPWILTAVGVAFVLALWLARRDLVRAARSGGGLKRRLVQAGLTVLAGLGVATGAPACKSHQPTCYSTEVMRAEGPSEAFANYEGMFKQAKALLDQTKRGLAAETVTKTAEGIEQKLIELEPGVNKLPKAERPHARRFVDQTLATLDAIRDLLAERAPQ